MKRVIVMMGVPGSGKSTYAKERFPGAKICSADDFHMKDGVYLFKPENIAAAHQGCWREFLGAALNDTDTIVIDNTNTREGEIAAYVLPAESLGYQVFFVAILGSAETFATRNTHGVPKETVLKMHDTLLKTIETFPPWWVKNLTFVGCTP